MVAVNSFDGLIVTTREHATESLTELAAVCGWPLLGAATARNLWREFSVRVPSCVLFWLDDHNHLAATARLIEWLRERHSSPFRLAVVCDLGGDAETQLRAAGAHTVLPVEGKSGAAIADSLSSLMQAADRNDVAPDAAAITPTTHPDATYSTDFIAHLTHPP
jgi:hypothetical protein